MPTNAHLAAELLRSSANFFRELGRQTPAITEQMENNAQTYEAVAELVEQDPHGTLTPSDEDDEDDDDL